VNNVRSVCGTTLSLVRYSNDFKRIDDEGHSVNDMRSACGTSCDRSKVVS
jgi:hypothetical protein